MLGDAQVVITDFVPTPLEDVRGRDAFLATTASGPAAARQAEHLEAEHGCRVVGWSARLADRAGLAADLDAAPGYEVLLTELKAAAVDVASERALARGADVVFVDNRAVVTDGTTDLTTAVHGVIELATTRGSAR
jgi:cyclic 2,3-diphosphoglycerate synthetase